MSLSARRRTPARWLLPAAAAALLALPAAANAAGSATLYVAPNGSDSNACTQSAPCASLDGGYQKANPGDHVQVAGGTYGNQRLYFDADKTSTTDVVIEP